MPPVENLKRNRQVKPALTDGSYLWWIHHPPAAVVTRQPRQASAEGCGKDCSNVETRVTPLSAKALSTQSAQPSQADCDSTDCARIEKRVSSLSAVPSTRSMRPTLSWKAEAKGVGADGNEVGAKALNVQLHVPSLLPAVTQTATHATENRPLLKPSEQPPKSSLANAMTKGGDGVHSMCTLQATRHARDTQLGGHADGDDSGENPGYPPESMFPQPSGAEIEVKALEPGETSREYASWRCQMGHQKVKPSYDVKLQHATASVKPPAMLAPLLTDQDSASTHEPSLYGAVFAKPEETLKDIEQNNYNAKTQPP